MFSYSFLLTFCSMKKKATHNIQPKTNHPFIRILEDNRRIQNAINKGQALSTLQGINFVKPI